MKTAIDLAESGWLPDAALRAGIRAMVSRRRRHMSRRAEGAPGTLQLTREFARSLEQDPIAVHPQAANDQHYEVPAAFFEHALGPRLKYSSCYYPRPETTLAEAEDAMLALTCERARLVDGMDVLELGCGWGSLTLWMAQQYPSSTITAVSNSAPQRAFIEGRAAAQGLRNVRVLTQDMNDFEAPGSYDRIVSIEMFEHLRNWPRVFKRLASWLRPGGMVFLHVFCHREQPYLYEDNGSGDWMARHFFTGGMMPSHDLPHHVNGYLQVEEKWKVDGTHYAGPANDWLANVDRQRGVLMPVLAETYGPTEARRWLHRWRLFFMGCAELFGHRSGQEWWVSHHLLRHRDHPSRWSAAVLLLMLLTSCRSQPKENPLQGMNEALARTTPELVGTVEPDSDEAEQALARFADLVADMSVERTPAMVAQVYADSVYFNDTLKEVVGAEALAAYFRHSLGGAEQVHAEVLDVAHSGADFYVRWQMTIRFRKLADGKPTVTTGISHLRFDRHGMIVFHQDYWDATAGFFQYVPVVGRLIGYVRSRL